MSLDDFYLHATPRWSGWVCVLAVGCLPAPSVAFDLRDAYEQARRHDPVFEASRHQHAAVQEKIPQARAGLLPELRVTGGEKRADGKVSFDQAAATDRVVHTRDLKIELVQPLVRAAQWAAYTQAELQALQADAHFLQAQHDLIVRVAQAYFDVLAADDSLTVAQAQLTAIEAQLDLVTRGFQAGTATVTDVHEARSRRDLAEAQRIAARGEREIKRSALEQILGAPFTTLAGLRFDRPLASPADDMARWSAVAREHNPAVTAQRAALAAAEQELKRAHAGHLPTVDLVVTRGRDYASGSLTSPSSIETSGRTTTAGLQFSWPLFASGATSARVREMYALADKARAELEVARRTAVHAVQQAHAGLVHGLSRVRALEQAVASSTQALEGNRIGFRIGTRLNADVLNAEQQLHSARRDLARARYDVLFQGLKLKASAGNLTEDDLLTVNAQLDAQTPSEMTP